MTLKRLGLFALVAMAACLNAATVAHVDARGRVIYQAEGAPARVAAASGYDIRLSPDGKRLISTRAERDMPQRTLVLCQDDMGKAAVRDGLKQIKLKNVKDKADMHLGYHNGVLEMRCAYALRTDGMYSDGTIRQLLENSL